MLGSFCNKIIQPVLLTSILDDSGTSAIRSQNQTPPGSPFHTAGASVQSSLPSPQQHDLSAINCDFLDDYTWAGMSYPSVGHYGLSNDVRIRYALSKARDVMGLPWGGYIVFRSHLRRLSLNHLANSLFQKRAE